MMLLRWFFTVRSLIDSLWAISLLASPAATCCRISTSRCVSGVSTRARSVTSWVRANSRITFAAMLGARRPSPP